MGTRLTVIVDNVAEGDWTGEWGLSILAEHRGKRILVDTGASDLFQKNMDRLGLSLELTQAGTAFLCTGHCPKQRAYDILHQELGDRLHQLDGQAPLRFSHENPQVQALYREFLGKPLSEISEYLLHSDHTAWAMPNQRETE